MPRFRTDNTDGYSTDDLAALNQAMRYIVESHELTEKSEIDAAMAELLAAYDHGHRNYALTAAYDRQHPLLDPQGRVHARYFRP